VDIFCPNEVESSIWEVNWKDNLKRKACEKIAYKY
jgi:hypothetical protein